MSLKSMMVYLCLVFAMLDTAHAGGVIVGNGGQGIESHGSLFLRDLFEDGVALAPDMGAKVTDTDELSKAIGLSFKIMTPAELNLLLQKLSDLSRRSPQLGLAIARTISAYNWVMIQEPLAPIPDQGDIIDSNGISVVQLANRYLTTIRISEPEWARLDQNNRVALILHEAVFSLLKPVCTSPTCSTLDQDAAQARSLTGALFLPLGAVSAPDLALLSIPTRMQSNSLEVEVLDAARDSKSCNDFSSHACRFELLSSACGMLMDTYPNLDETIVKIEIHAGALGEVTLQPYSSSRGEQFAAIAHPLVINFDARLSLPMCQSELLEEIHSHLP